MRRVVTDEGLNVSQPVRKRWARSAAIAEEAEACGEQGLHLCPLLQVYDGRRFERAAHLVDCPAATRADGRQIRTGSHLKALAAVKAGMGNQVFWTWHPIHPLRRLTPELSRPAKRVRLE
jgi:hypothetical protein